VAEAGSVFDRLLTELFAGVRDAKTLRLLEPA
jgi:hypothetical protein